MHGLLQTFFVLLIVSCAETNCLIAFQGEANSGTTASEDPAKRHFTFHYGGTVRDLPADKLVRVWIPVAQSGQYQEIKALKWQLPMEAQIKTENVFGNKILYFEFTPIETTDLPFSVSYDVIRTEARALTGNRDEKLDEETRAQFLKPNRLVPVEGPPLELLESMTLPPKTIDAGRQLYDRVEQYMTYDKSVPGYGNGDSVWACNSKTGNCTDFHSLFISLARSQNIPARFEIGFPLPPEPGTAKISGYHCWASFYTDEQGWVPVDISEADKHPELKKYYFGNLTPHRITFTVGRDIDLNPKQSGSALNYFVYPYVEVDGQSLPKENIDLEFRYADVPAKPDSTGQNPSTAGQDR